MGGNITLSVAEKDCSLVDTNDAAVLPLTVGIVVGAFDDSTSNNVPVFVGANDDDSIVELLLVVDIIVGNDDSDLTIDSSVVGSSDVVELDVGASTGSSSGVTSFLSPPPQTQQASLALIPNLPSWLPNRSHIVSGKKGRSVLYHVQSYCGPLLSCQPSGESLHASSDDGEMIGGDDTKFKSDSSVPLVIVVFVGDSDGGLIGSDVSFIVELDSPPPHTQQAILAVLPKLAYISPYCSHLVGAELSGFSPYHSQLNVGPPVSCQFSGEFVHSSSAKTVTIVGDAVGGLLGSDVVSVSPPPHTQQAKLAVLPKLAYISPYSSHLVGDELPGFSPYHSQLNVGPPVSCQFSGEFLQLINDPC